MTWPRREDCGSGSCPARTLTASASPRRISSPRCRTRSGRTARARSCSSRGCTWSPTTAAPGTSTCSAGTWAGGPGAVSGIKVVGDFHRNWQRGLPSEMGLLTLYDPETGTPRAVLDATLITACRTGAMTAVGARFLARPDARVLGHAGSRGTAFWNVTLLDALFRLDEIRVTSARPESREAFAEQLRAVTTPVRVTGSVEEAFDGADILVEATRLTEPAPLLHPGLVRPGALVVPYGTVSAVHRDLLRVIDKVVVDDWREAQSGRFGALRAQVDSGELSADTLHAELGQVVTGQRPGREPHDERILFWHRGLSLLDVAVGRLILRRAEEPGRHGAPLPVTKPARVIAQAGELGLGLIGSLRTAGRWPWPRPAGRRAAPVRAGPRGAGDGRPVYGVNTGMGALSGVGLTEASSARTSGT